MKASLFEQVLQEIRHARFAVEEIEYCGQGDPLMNPDFPAFVRSARKHYPQTCQRLITNGNFEYAKATGLEAIDEIFVSCDGVRQQSYEQYRVRGSVDRALTFMRNIPRQLKGRKQRVIWKYILFEFNDSDEELREAQNTAQELGVNTLLFVYTHSKFRSQRYTVDNSAEFPIFHANVRVNATPIHYRNSHASLSSFFGAPSNIGHHLMHILRK